VDALRTLIRGKDHTQRRTDRRILRSRPLSNLPIPFSLSPSPLPFALCPLP
jgi:hypothetical protein